MASIRDILIGDAVLKHGDAANMLKTIPAQSIQCCVSSPPYWRLRDYCVDGQIGQEKTKEEYVKSILDVFSEVYRALKDDGTLWLNIGDTYSSNKELTGIPWLVAFALKEYGWYLRSDIIWHKPNGLCESVRDRPTRSHEHILFLTKNRNYYYDTHAMREKAAFSEGVKTFSGTSNQTKKTYYSDGKRHKRDVWSVNTLPFKEAHFATYPPQLIEPCILAGSKEGDVILDPFNGSGTTGEVALKNGRKYIGIELNVEYLMMAKNRLSSVDKTKKEDEHLLAQLYDSIVF